MLDILPNYLVLIKLDGNGSALDAVETGDGPGRTDAPNHTVGVGGLPNTLASGNGSKRRQPIEGIRVFPGHQNERRSSRQRA